MSHATFSQKKRARDGGTSGRLADKENPLPAAPNIPDIGDIAEQVDNGKRLALVEASADLSRVQRMRLEMGTTRAEMALEHLEDFVRPEIREAMKLADTVEDRELHIAIGKELIRFDGLLSVLRERQS